MAQATTRTGHVAPAHHTILVVDDEYDVREAIRAFLLDNLRGAQVVVAASGAEGLAIMAGQSVDLVVADFNMPGMNGVQFLSEALRMAPGLPHILVTAFLSEALEATPPLAAGGLLLHKPFGPQALLRDVEEALAGVVHDEANNP